MKHILFFFLDGVGLGPNRPFNPFADSTQPTLHQLGGQKWHQPFRDIQSETHLVRSIDATLGVEGLPQSGTGQASLFTGVNCAEIVGRHFGPFPHSKTHAVLNKKNIFQRLKSLPKSQNTFAFANAFPPQYFEATQPRSTVTTHCCESANVELRDLTALREQRALAADLTSTSWRTDLHLDVPEQSLSEAAGVLASITRNHSLTLFEYFHTDKVGHTRIDMPPTVLLEDLDYFFNSLLEQLDPSNDALLITSDHGNLENTSHTQHTRNPVPLIVYGWAAPFFEDVTNLTEVTPALVQAFKSSSSPKTGR